MYTEVYLSLLSKNMKKMLEEKFKNYTICNTQLHNFLKNKFLKAYVFFVSINLSLYYMHKSIN